MVKPKTINLNSVRLNTVALNHYGNISGGGSKPDPIAAWIRKHMAFRYDTKGYTNEVLSQTKQLEDLSGNNRPMLLNNFLFDAMSGMGGYKNHRFNQDLGIKFETVLDRYVKGKPDTKGAKFGYYYVQNHNGNILYVNWHIEGIKEGNKIYIMQFNTQYDLKIELHNGDNHVAFDITDSPSPNYRYITVAADQPYSTDITITQIPEYPGALVTDGVDDYGLVENLSSGVKMLFMTVNPMSKQRVLYDARNNSGFAIYNSNETIAYQVLNKGGFTYINGVLNKTKYPYDLVGEKQVITICNDTVPDSAKSIDILFASFNRNENMSCAFYNSIAFDAIPTEEDGFTEQELIDYVIEKYELNKI